MASWSGAGRGRAISLIVLGTDITKHVLDQRRAEEYARFPLENPNPVMRIDIQGDISLANDAAQKIITDLALGDDEDTQHWRNLMRIARNVTKPFQSEINLLDKDYLFNIIPDIENNYINIYATDISRLRETESRLNDVVSSVNASIFQYVLHADGTDSIRYMNPGTFNIWELEAEDIGEDPALMWAEIHPDDLDSLVESVQVSARDLSHWQQEYRIITRSGQLKWLRSSGKPRALDNGDTLWNTVIMEVTELQEALDSKDEVLRKAIFALSAALESRDPYTAGHEQRVAEIAMKIGAEMGLEQSRIDGLELAGIIHDIGKIQVPAEILSKPTGLTQPEFEIIKAHPETGARILSGIEFQWPIAKMVLQHHERMDGSGYPGGLKGDEILLDARILAVADTLEAMVSHRPYRPGLGIDKAVAELESGAGSRYDADVVRSCLHLVRSGEIVL